MLLLLNFREDTTIQRSRGFVSHSVQGGLFPQRSRGFVSHSVQGGLFHTAFKGVCFTQRSRGFVGEGQKVLCNVWNYMYLVHTLYHFIAAGSDCHLNCNLHVNSKTHVTQCKYTSLGGYYGTFDHPGHSMPESLTR